MPSVSSVECINVFIVIIVLLQISAYGKLISAMHLFNNQKYSIEQCDRDIAHVITLQKLSAVTLIAAIIISLWCSEYTLTATALIFWVTGRFIFGRQVCKFVRQNIKAASTTSDMASPEIRMNKV